MLTTVDAADKTKAARETASAVTCLSQAAVSETIC
jgi:hypothetical protein